MQINRTGYGLLALFGLGGITFILLLPWNPIGYIWVVTTIGLIAYAIVQSRKAKRDMKLFKTGIRGRATVVEARSGALINDQPMMHLKLDLDVPGQGQRSVDRKELMSSFVAYRIKPGLVLPVVVDPQDPDEFVLVW